MRTIFFFSCLLLIYTSSAQSIDGVYKGNEQRRYQLDDFGNVVYIPNSLYPWYFEVTVKISSERLDVLKRYVYTDSLAKKHYADSSSNTYHYAAKLIKVQDRYLAKTVLINKPAWLIYINGKYSREANHNNIGLLYTIKEEQNLYRWYQYSDGKFWIYKEEIEQGLIIKPDTNGIWINNKFYKKVKE